METQKKTSELPVSSFSYHSLLPFGMALILIIAGLLGCLAIYSSRSFTEYTVDFMLRQLRWLAAGIALFTGCALIPFRIYRKAAFPFLLTSQIFLLLVLIFGYHVNGMQGWFDLGFCKIQPSEFAKDALLLYLCVYCGAQHEMRFINWLYLFALMGVMLTLILLEPDFGMALTFFIIFMITAFLKGISIPYFTAATGSMILVGVVFLLHNDYAVKRIIGFLSATDARGVYSWHIQQFQYTMAHGGWFGADWGNTLWSGAFLPYPHTDSLYASIVEATGFTGGILVLLAFLIMAIFFCIWSWKLKGNGNDRRYLVFCTGTVTAVQALIHCSVNSVLIPPTGVVLPILSYGGSSLLSLLLLFGIAFSAIRYKEDTENIEPIDIAK